MLRQDGGRLAQQVGVDLVHVDGEHLPAVGQRCHARHGAGGHGLGGAVGAAHRAHEGDAAAAAARRRRHALVVVSAAADGARVGDARDGPGDLRRVRRSCRVVLHLSRGVVSRHVLL